MIDQILEAAKVIQSRGDFIPEVGIILGTGLGGLVSEIEPVAVIPYEQIPHFPVSTVEFHKGELILGYLAGKKVVVMHGRFHYYEGYTMQQITFPVRVMKLLGIKKLFVSNAAGGLNKSFAISDLMIISDHINLLPENPLRGANLDEFGGRFPDMSEPYDLKLIDQAVQWGRANNVRLHTGVYCGVQGPNLETRAEYHFLTVIGADAVGMSTIPENIVARHMNLPCFAVSVITDLCFPETLKEARVEEIIAAARVAEPKLTQLFRELIRIQE